MFLNHHTPQLLAPPLPSWGNSVVRTVTESSGTSACWGYGFSEAVLRKTADLVPKVPLPFPSSGLWERSHTSEVMLHSCPRAPGPSLDWDVCLFAPTWLSIPAQLEDWCLFPGLQVLLLLLDEKYQVTTCILLCNSEHLHISQTQVLQVLPVGALPFQNDFPLFH